MYTTENIAKSKNSHRHGLPAAKYT